MYTLEHRRRLLLTPSSNALPDPETTDRHPRDFKKHSDTLPRSLQRAAAPCKEPTGTWCLGATYPYRQTLEPSWETGSSSQPSSPGYLRMLPHPRCARHMHTDPEAEGSLYGWSLSPKISPSLLGQNCTILLFKIKTLFPPDHASNELTIQPQPHCP